MLGRLFISMVVCRFFHMTISFKMIISQFYINGNAIQSEIAKAFGITLVSVKRAVKTYRTQGVDGFYAPKKTRGAAVLYVTH